MTAALAMGGLLEALLPLGVIAGPASAEVAPAPNPLIADSCGIDVSMVLDASGSVGCSGAVEDVREMQPTPSSSP